jgi:formylmethanofuran dehydrogenase subunit C
VKPLVLRLRQRPEQRLDLSPLVPHLLAGKTAAEIERLELQTTKHRVTVGDAFRLRLGAFDHVRIEGACDRLDRIGRDMGEGEIVVEGDVGIQAGRGMCGGRLAVEGNAGAWAGSGMSGGQIEIFGAAAERLGGPLPGETAGMRGGVVVVRGDAGDRAGDRMRRGVIIVEGDAAAHAGSRMIAGTLIVCRRCGPMPGYLMRRGTIVLAGDCEELSPTFVDCGVHELVAMRLMAAFVGPYSKRAAAVVRGRLRRLAGDMAVLGKGELFVKDRG